jgi:hypothetical protein
VIALLVTGCGGDAPPAPTATPTPSIAATPAISETATEPLDSPRPTASRREKPLVLTGTHRLDPAVLFEAIIDRGLGEDGVEVERHPKQKNVMRFMVTKRMNTVSGIFRVATGSWQLTIYELPWAVSEKEIEDSVRDGINELVSKLERQAREDAEKKAAGEGDREP